MDCVIHSVPKHPIEHQTRSRDNNEHGQSGEEFRGFQCGLSIDFPSRTEVGEKGKGHSKIPPERGKPRNPKTAECKRENSIAGQHAHSEPKCRIKNRLTVPDVVNRSSNAQQREEHAVNENTGVPDQPENRRFLRNRVDT